MVFCFCLVTLKGENISHWNHVSFSNELKQYLCMVFWDLFSGYPASTCSVLIGMNPIKYSFETKGGEKHKVPFFKSSVSAAPTTSIRPHRQVTPSVPFTKPTVLTDNVWYVFFLKSHVTEFIRVHPVNLNEHILRQFIDCLCKNSEWDNFPKKYC